MKRKIGYILSEKKYYMNAKLYDRFDIGDGRRHIEVISPGATTNENLTEK